MKIKKLIKKEEKKKKSIVNFKEMEQKHFEKVVGGGISSTNADSILQLIR